MTITQIQETGTPEETEEAVINALKEFTGSPENALKITSTPDQLAHLLKGITQVVDRTIDLNQWLSETFFVEFDDLLTLKPQAEPIQSLKEDEDEQINSIISQSIRASRENIKLNEIVLNYLKMNHPKLRK